MDIEYRKKNKKLRQRTATISLIAATSCVVTASCGSGNQSEIIDLQNNLIKKTDELLEAKQEIQATKNEKAKVQNEVDSITNLLNNANQEKNDLISQKQVLENDKSRMQGLIDSFTTSLGDIQKKLPGSPQNMPDFDNKLDEKLNDFSKKLGIDNAIKGIKDEIEAMIKSIPKGTNEDKLNNAINDLNAKLGDDTSGMTKNIKDLLDKNLLEDKEKIKDVITDIIKDSLAKMSDFETKVANKFEESIAKISKPILDAINSITSKHTTNDEEKNNLTDQIKKHSEEFEKVKKELLERKVELQKSKEENAKIDEKTKELNTKITELEQNKKQLEDQIKEQEGKISESALAKEKEFLERIKDKEKSLEKLKTQITELQSNSETNKSKEEKQNVEIDSLKEQLKLKQEQLKTKEELLKKQKIDISSLESTVEESNKKAELLAKEKEEINKKLNLLEDEKTKIEEEKNNYKNGMRQKVNKMVVDAKLGIEIDKNLDNLDSIFDELAKKMNKEEVKDPAAGVLNEQTLEKPIVLTEAKGIVDLNKETNKDKVLDPVVQGENKFNQYEISAEDVENFNKFEEKTKFLDKLKENKSLILKLIKNEDIKKDVEQCCKAGFFRKSESVFAIKQLIEDDKVNSDLKNILQSLLNLSNHRKVNNAISILRNTLKKLDEDEQEAKDHFIANHLYVSLKRMESMIIDKRKNSYTNISNKFAFNYKKERLEAGIVTLDDFKKWKQSTFIQYGIWYNMQTLSANDGYVLGVDSFDTQLYMEYVKSNISSLTYCVFKELEKKENKQVEIENLIAKVCEEQGLKQFKDILMHALYLSYYNYYLHQNMMYSSYKPTPSLEDYLKAIDTNKNNQCFLMHMFSELDINNKTTARGKKKDVRLDDIFIPKQYEVVIHSLNSQGIKPIIFILKKDGNDKKINSFNEKYKKEFKAGHEDAYSKLSEENRKKIDNILGCEIKYIDDVVNDDIFKEYRENLKVLLNYTEKTDIEKRYNAVDLLRIFAMHHLSKTSNVKEDYSIAYLDWTVNYTPNILKSDNKESSFSLVAPHFGLIGIGAAGENTAMVYEYKCEDKTDFWGQKSVKDFYEKAFKGIHIQEYVYSNLSSFPKTKASKPIQVSRSSGHGGGLLQINDKLYVEKPKN